MMQRRRKPLLLLCLTAAVAMNILGDTAEAVEGVALEVKNLTNKSLQVIPHSGNSSSLTKLMVEGNSITLTEEDGLALASYPALVELHLDDNRVTDVPAKYFSVVPRLRVLSLSRNNISGLDPEAFSGLDDLTDLDLSHNLLTSLPTQLLRGLNNLQVLNLQENPWNCSCPLLSSIREVAAGNVSIGGPRATCASPENQAGLDLLEAAAVCYPATSPTFATDTQKPKTHTTVNSEQSQGSSTVLKTTQSSIKNITINRGQTPVLGNTWKFTACVAALALITSMLIVCAIKGPSLYKLFHNYQHRRLDQEEDEEEDVVSTVFSGTGRYVNHQTFTFEQGNAQIEIEEEEEDGYFEDPYIKRDE
ncbi:leucine-rich repeat-containing protein 19-like [Seriola lalandi dorsalis]|uniref:Leucine-rich repeat-containing protein 19-like n=1 Tax=Seriola lalandi dorsalis TaxID=1841481 RepID=A0A3B4WXF9_SERLL|nr:leucine-rich repeat-containing protein 19-like [Seriola lalandi dorsalis]